MPHNFDPFVSCRNDKDYTNNPGVQCRGLAIKIGDRISGPDFNPSNASPSGSSGSFRRELPSNFQMAMVFLTSIYRSFTAFMIGLSIGFHCCSVGHWPRGFFPHESELSWWKQCSGDEMWQWEILSKSSFEWKDRLINGGCSIADFGWPGGQISSLDNPYIYIYKYICIYISILYVISSY